MEPTPELLAYIREQLKAGFTRDVLHTTLIDAGWQATMVDAAFLQIVAEQKSTTLQQPVVEPAPVATAEPIAQTQQDSFTQSQPQAQSTTMSPMEAYTQVFSPVAASAAAQASTSAQVAEPVAMSDSFGPEATLTQEPLVSAQQMETVAESHDEVFVPGQATEAPSVLSANPATETMTYGTPTSTVGTTAASSTTSMTTHRPSMLIRILEGIAIFLMLIIIGGLVYLIVRSAQGHEALAFSAPDWLGAVGDKVRGLFDK